MNCSVIGCWSPAMATGFCIRHAGLAEGLLRRDYKYRGWTIHYDPAPIPIRDFDWHAVGPNYDASWEGEEDGWVDNGEKVCARTREEIIREIDAWFEEQSA